MKVKTLLLIVGVVFGLAESSLIASDPTRPDVVVPKTVVPSKFQAMKLTMIRSSDKGNYAVINGRSYAKGDRVGSYTVKTIGTSEVVLKNNKGTVRLSLLTKGALRKKS